jgi:diguanylate cyclase (GGDEF)-like protein/PAS domain S-box-containing protein
VPPCLDPLGRQSCPVSVFGSEKDGEWPVSVAEREPVAVAGEAMLFEAVVLNANDVVLVTEAEPFDAASGGPRVVYVNPAFTRMTGYLPGDIVGKTPRILQSPKTDRKELGRLREALNAWAPVEVELLNVRKDGSEFWVQINITPVMDERGWYTHWVAIQREITERKRREIALQSVLEYSSDLVVGVQPDGRAVSVSPTVDRILGLPVERLLGDGLAAQLHPDDAQALMLLLAPPYGLRMGRSATTELRLRHADGSWRWFDVSALDLGGRQALGSVVFTCAEITARKDSEAELARTGALLHGAFADAPVGMAVTDAEGRHIQVNEAFGRLVGQRCAQLLTTGLPQLVHPDDRDALSSQLRGLASGAADFYARELRLVHGDGSYVWALHSSSRLASPDAGDVHLIHHLEDITDRRSYQDQLTRQALHDSLTGLPNRALLMDRLERSLASENRQQQTLALVFLDLDRFKTINDTLGHAAGDEVLTVTADRIRSAIRESDTAARFGGDEFVLLFEETKAADAVAVARKLLAALGAPIRIKNRSVATSVSVGVALSRANSTAEGLLREADAAMYAAKDAGRARVEVFDARSSHGGRRQREDELLSAVNSGELVLHYQPVVRLSERTQIGREALVRWHHPERGLLAPQEFIPLAESGALIHPLGNWVLRQAMLDAGAQGTGFGPTWINLSTHQLGDATLPARISALLDEFGLSVADIGFEVTESVLIDEVEPAMNTLEAIRGLGISLALDDFGTGYSSLSYLARFPVDIVKIDQSFTKGLDQDGTRRESFAIVSAVVALGHALRLEVVAEGIETAAQATILQGLGCDIGQGYLLGRPEPLSTSTARVEQTDA